MHSRFHLPYRLSTDWQLELVRRRIQDEVPDLLMMVEHEPVVTLGSSAKEDHLLLSPEDYAKQGIKVIPTKRGGDVTYHGPGQLVVYPIMKLTGPEQDPHAYLHNLEGLVIQTLKAYHIEAFRKPGKTGAWTDQGKIAAIGVYLKRWVTFHGLALNIHPDLSGFESIVPCGLQDRRIATMARLCAPKPPPAMDDVAGTLARTAKTLFKRDFHVLHGASLINRSPTEEEELSE